MKKVLVFISAAALLFASCSKIAETGSVANDQEITFQTATHVTKVTGSVFPTTETFSVYAWTEASVLPYFMENETVAFNGTDWKTQGATYYWPKSSTVDFIAYYPTGLNGITVAEKKITFTGIDANTLQEDIMYSDKAAGFSNNVDLMSDGVNQYTGVPLIFRHALAKVKVIVELAYNHKAEADGTVTDWAVKVNSLNVNDIFTTGSCVLNLDTTPAEGIIGWTRPQDADGHFVWTPTTATTNFAGLTDQSIVPGTEYEAISERYVLPQTLAAGSQTISVDLTIETTRNSVKVLEEKNIVRTANLFVSTLPAWEMNHVYTYRLVLTPTASNGNGGNPFGPNDPPVDPNDPNLDDVIITFDPAVDGWENIGVETVLNI